MAHTQQGRLVKGGGQEVCVNSRDQLGVSTGILRVCSRGQGWLQVHIPGSGGRGRVVVVEGASICKQKNPWVEKLSGKVCWGSTAAVKAVGFFSGESCPPLGLVCN